MNTVNILVRFFVWVACAMGLALSMGHAQSGSINEVITGVNESAASADVVFVVDNSVSMYKYLRNNLNRSSLVGFLEAIEGLDYRLTVTTTDIKNRRPGAYGHLWPLFESKNKSQLHRNAGYDYYIDSTSSIQDAQYVLHRAFRRIRRIGNALSSSHQEAGLTAFMYLLARHFKIRYGIADGGALRDDVDGLAVVVISDSDEMRSGTTVGQLLDRVSFIFPRSTGFVWNSIVAMPGNRGCGCRGEKKGRLYTEASRITGGLVASVCSRDYSEHLTAIGQRIRKLVDPSE